MVQKLTKATRNLINSTQFFELTQLDTQPMQTQLSDQFGMYDLTSNSKNQFNLFDSTES